MVYSGTGGPPPAATAEARKKSGLPGGQKPFGFKLTEDLPSGKTKDVSLFRVNPGEKDVPLLILDAARVETAEAPSVRVHHGIKFNGSFGHIIVCACHRSAGCPIDPVFTRPNKFTGKTEPTRGAWRWVLTGIKMKPFTYTKGKLAGKTVPFQRCAVLVPERAGPSGGVTYDDVMAYREQFDADGGLRGRVFNVRRSSDSKSSTIGTMWTPSAHLTDEQMMAKFEQAAADYGLPVERYIAPFDYERVLRVLPEDELERAAKWIAAEIGASTTEQQAPKVLPVSQSTVDTTAEDDDSDEIPF